MRYVCLKLSASVSKYLITLGFPQHESGDRPGCERSAPGWRLGRAPERAPLKTEESTRSGIAERVDSTGVNRIYTS